MKTHARWLPFGLLLFFLIGCGDSPTTPSAPPAVSPATSLHPGSYYFVVSQGSNTFPAPNGGTLNTWTCLGVGSYPTSVQVPVIVESEGRNYRARAVSGTLLLNLVLSEAGANGTVQGTADDGTGVFSLSVQGEGTASISGVITSASTASGTVQGDISLMGPKGYGGCSPSTWGLMAR